MSSFYAQQREAYLKELSIKADRVLDVGGVQSPVKNRVASWDVGHYALMDLPSPHKVKDPSVPWIEWDLNNDSLDADGKSFFGGLGFLNSYDVVFCLEVMEYIWNPVAALNTICSLTAGHGTLFISFPFVYPVHEPIAYDYLRYTKAGAHKLLQQCGFKVDQCYNRHTQRASLAQFYSAEQMRASKGYELHEAVGFIIKAIKL